MAQTRQSLIINIPVGELDFTFIQALRINREAVIVRGDFDAARAHVSDRMIAAAMTEFQLEGCAAESVTENLMTETDAEDRRRAEQLSDFINNRRERRRIARPV